MADSLSKLEQYLEIQKSVISTALVNPEALTIFCTILPGEDFFHDKGLRLIAKTLFKFHSESKPCDLISLVTYLRSNDQLEAAGGRSEVSKLYATAGIDLARFERHLRLLQEIWAAQKMKAIGTALATGELSPDKDVFETISRFITASENVLNQIVTADEPEFFDVLDEHSKKWGNPGLKIAGFETGFDTLDLKLGGWVNSNLIILAARPGQGKTAFALSVLRRLCQLNIPVGMFSLEMGRFEIMDRLLSMESNVFAYKIKRNQLDTFDVARLQEAKARMKGWTFKISDTASLNIRTLKAKAMLWKKKYGIKFLVIDYMQLMSGTGKKGQNREQEISEISRGLKVLAKDLDIPIMALSQLSRAVESRPSKMPQLSDLRESGSIEQDANIVLFLMRPDYYQMTDQIEFEGVSYDPKGLCIVDIAKFRDGDVCSFPMVFKAENTEFIDHVNFKKAPTAQKRIEQFETPGF